MRAFLLVVVLVALCMWAGSARAQVDADACLPHGKCDQGEAYSAAMAQGRSAGCAGMYNPVNESTRVYVHSPNRYTYAITCYRANFNERWEQIGSHTFYWGASCSQRNVTYPPGDMQPSQAQPPSDCYGGCKLSGTSVKATTGGITIYGVVNRTYTGDACSRQNDSNAPIDAKAEAVAETEPKTPECTALGNGQTACQKPNGDYCATASNGVTVCWSPTEEGAKIDGEHAQVKGEKAKPVKPPDVSIPDKDWQRKEGHQMTACVNSTCKTYNVTNFGTVAAGTAKNSTAPNSADGSGNTSGKGQGSGTGVGSGKDDGKEDSASESGNCTTPPVCVGDTLKCLQLKLTWKIDCNTKSNEITNGEGCSDGDVPVCSGESCKAEKYAQVLQQWKQRCALKAMADGNASRAQGINNGDDEGVVDSIWITPDNNGLTLKQDIITVADGGSLLPDVEIEGQAWTVPQGFYDAIAGIKMVIIAMCTVIAFFVVGRNI